MSSVFRLRWRTRPTKKRVQFNFVAFSNSKQVTKHLQTECIIAILLKRIFLQKRGLQHNPFCSCFQLESTTLTTPTSGGSLISTSSSASEVAASGSDEPQCQLDFSPMYSITSSIVSFFLPCAIMLIIYFHLFAIAKRHLEEMK